MSIKEKMRKNLMKAKAIRAKQGRLEGAEITGKYKGEIQNLINDMPKITAPEIKGLADEIKLIVDEKPNQKLTAIYQGLSEVYDKVKNYKQLPIDSLNKTFLKMFAEVDDNDPECVVAFKNKCLIIKESIYKKEVAQAEKSKFFCY